MEMRHLRCFHAVAEELHFTRAAERLHIEQSPLSRAIRELEHELGTALFIRDRRRTRLTPAGEILLLHVRRLFATLEQARDGVAAVASGYSGTLHIAVSDGAIGPKLSALLARCREEEPEVEVRLNEVSLTAQVRGLRDGHFDAGFARSADVGIGIVTEPVWKNAISVAVPARHPLLAHREVPLLELVRYPIVACAPHVFEGCYSELTRLFRSIDAKPIIAGHAASVDMQLVLVAAGYGVGLTALAHTPAIWQHPGVIARPLQGTDNVLTTYLLRAEGLPSATLDRFTARVRAVEGDELS